MDVLSIQIIFFFVFLTVKGVMGLAPIFLGNINDKYLPRPSLRPRLLSLASCFAGGVFLFVCFLGLIPEADIKFHTILKSLEENGTVGRKFISFPWCHFIVVMGFLCIFTLDKMIHASEHVKTGRRMRKQNVKEQQQHHVQIDVQTKFLITPSGGIPVTPVDIDNTMSALHNHQKEVKMLAKPGGGGHGVPSSAIVLVALATHCVFEGMAIGLQTSPEKVLEFAVAILIHEAIMAATFGVEVSKSTELTLKMKVVYVMIFDASIPLGIVIGILLQNVPLEHHMMISGICEAFASGIFLHVIFIEVLGEEFPEPSHQDTSVQDSCGVVSIPRPPPTSSIWLVFEKILCVCLGLLLLILLDVFAH